MAKYSGANVGFLLVGGRDLAAVASDVTEEREALTEETTPLGPTGTWQTHAAVGTFKGTLQQNGWYNDAALSSNEAFVGKQSTLQVVAFAPEGNTVGKKLVQYVGAFAAKLQRLFAKDALVKANATYVVSGNVDDGRIIHDLKQETVAGNTNATSVSEAALTSNGGSAVAQFTQLTLGGYTNVIVTVRHSADNVTFADLVAMSPVNASTNPVPCAERKLVAAGTTVNRYLSAQWAWTGAGAGQSVTFALGFARY